MVSRISLWAGVMALLIIAGLSGLANCQVPAVQLEPHDFRGYGMDCRSCHEKPGIREAGRLIKPVSKICAGCHPSLGRSHPVDIVPSFKLPQGFPLDENKRMTCTTCHDPHRSYRDPVTGGRSQYLRRTDSKKAFCMLCHNK